jgi:hypothetical protein
MAQNAGSYNNVLGFGDYNFPNVKWEIGALPPRIESITNENRQLNRLLEFLRSQLMFQVVMAPTRKKNTLDLILVNNERMINNYDQQVNETLSDHNTLVVEMNCVPEKTAKEKPLKEYYITDIHRYDTRLKNNESRWDDFTRLMNLDNWEDEGYVSDN